CGDFLWQAGELALDEHEERVALEWQAHCGHLSAAWGRVTRAVTQQEWDRGRRERKMAKYGNQLSKFFFPNPLISG
ncbi:hypothetical protein H0H92_006721, partial [Tricholoma furcatifolium]